jgi:hypothetical protein
MILPETSAELSLQLTNLLLNEGKVMPDRLEVRVRDDYLGDIKLNDYWNGFHVAHAGSRHYQDPHSFYNEGHIPILGLHQEAPAISVFVFRPIDVSLQGLGSILLQELPDELVESDRIITTKDYAVLHEPLQDTALAEMLEKL